jgi:hypothetical protein
VTGIETVLTQAAEDLDGMSAQWAIIGGLAVSARTAPRFTQDIDFAVSVTGDTQAEWWLSRSKRTVWQPSGSFALSLAVRRYS